MILVAFSLTLLALAVPGLAQEPSTQPAAPASFTPGDVALFVLNVADASVQRNLTLALRDPSPDVRAVAARVAGVSGSKGQIPALLRGLPGESDELAAGEMVRALLVLQGEAADAALLPEVTRIGTAAAHTYGEVLVRVRPDAFITAVPSLVKMRGMEWGVGELAALGMRAHPTRTREIGERIVATGSARALSGLLWGSLGPAAATDVLLAALGADAPQVREVAVWQVVRGILHDGEVFDPLINAAMPSSPAPAAGGPEPSWEQYGRELVARSRGRRVESPTWAALIRTHASKARSLALDAESDLFTKSERRALEALLPADVRPGKRNRSVERLGNAWVELPAGASTVRWVVPGLGLDLLRVTGCIPTEEERIVLAGVEYRADGAVARAAVASGGMQPACARAAQAAVSLSVLPDHLPSKAPARQPAVVVLDGAALDCQKEWPIRRGDVLPPGPVGDSVIHAPTKTSNTTPVYPPSAMEQRIQGVVLLNASITHKGCVADVDVVRSLPELDLSSIAAVLKWRYTPALLNEQPVPVLMTVTVNYSLEYK